MKVPKLSPEMADMTYCSKQVQLTPMAWSLEHLTAVSQGSPHRTQFGNATTGTATETTSVIDGVGKRGVGRTQGEFTVGATVDTLHCRILHGAAPQVALQIKH
jgi:hypothetical protein